MKKNRTLLLFALLQACLAYSNESNDSTAIGACCRRPDQLAPAGVMIDHVHEKGRFGLAYSFMTMTMQGNQSGTSSVSDNQIFNQYMMAPATMNMQMHMLMPMYGITDRLTAMAMINYNVYNMTMHMLPMQNMMMNMPGMTMTDYTKMPSSTKSSGWGDTELCLLYNLLNSCKHRLIIGFGVSLPTGSITNRGVTMQSNNDVLAYSMQTGTGTYNLLPSLVYTAQMNRFTLGVAFQSNIKLGVNSRNYSWGNEYRLSPWLSYKISPWVSLSLRAETYYMGGIQGYDVDINQSSGNDPSANMYNYGSRESVNAFAGVNLYAPRSFFKGLYLLLEYGMPVYQDLQGLPLPAGSMQQEFQMPTKSMFTARLQYNF